MDHGSPAPSPTPSAGEAQHWHFGSIEVQESPERILVAGKLLDLDRNSHLVLCELLRHTGEVVTKDELLTAGWLGRIVSENSLAKAISRLRLLLGDDGAAIKSVYGYGYRLVATVQWSIKIASATPVPGTDDWTEPNVGAEVEGLAGWRLVRRLGENPGSVVMLALSDGAANVLKFARNEAGQRRLRREAALQRYLSESGCGLTGLVPVLSFHAAATPPFLAMPYYVQGDLRQMSLRGGALADIPLAERIELAAGLCDTVAALHSLGILHKDIKPANLYLVERMGRKQLLLGDLGSARAEVAVLAGLGATVTMDEGSAGQIGSAFYVAPEVLGGEAPSDASDVYALGVLMLQLFSDNLFSSFAPGWEDRIPHSVLRDDIRAAAGDAETRPTAHELAIRLRSADERLRTSEALDDNRKRLAAREAQLVRVRNRRRIWALSSLGLGLGLAVAIAMYLRADRALQHARLANDQKQAVVAFLNKGILQQADPYTLDRQDQAMKRAVLTAADKIDSSLGAQPEIAAETHGIIGEILVGLREYDRSITHYRKAIEHASRAGRGGDLLRQLQVGLCDAARSRMDFNTARAACGEAERLAVESGTSLVDVWLEQGQLLFETGQCQPSIAKFDRVASAGGDATTVDDLYDARYYTALCLQELGRYGEAARVFESLYRQHMEEDTPQSLHLAWLLSDYGYLLAELRDPRAETMLRRAQDLFHATLHEEHPDYYAADYGLALLDIQEARWQSALQRLEPIHQIELTTIGSAHLWTLMTCSDLAWAEAEAGRRAESLAHMAECMRAAAPRAKDFGSRYSFLADRWIRTSLALGRHDIAGKLMPVQEGLLRGMPPGHVRNVALADHRSRMTSLAGTQSRNDAEVPQVVGSR